MTREERACDWEVTWHDVIDLEESRVVWKDLGSRKIGKSLGLGWHQGTWVPYGVHMVHACMTEIKEYDVKAHGHDIMALRKMHGGWVMDMRTGHGH